MPLGAFRLNSLSRYIAAAAAGRTPVTVTANGDAQVDTAQSKFGGASVFLDGTSDVLNAGETVIPTAVGSTWTAECWFRQSATQSATKYFFSNQGSAGQDLAMFIRNDNQIGLFVNSTVTGFFSGTGYISNDTWHHLAWTRNGTDYAIYIDGVQRNTRTASDVATDESTLRIGAQTTTGNNSINGWMDEIRISDTVRYTGNFTPSTTPFVNDANTLLLLHCDGTDASKDFRDDNGLGRSAVGVSAVGNAQVDIAQSQFGGASLLLDGTTDHLTVGNELGITRSDDFTYEGWIRFNTLPSNVYYMFGGANDRLHLYLGLRDRGSGTWSLNSAVDDGSNAYYLNYFTPSSVVTGVWYHFAMVKEGAEIRLYWNGTLLTSVQAEVGTMTSGHGWQNLDRVGNWTSGTDYTVDGWMDEIRFSNTARYTANFTPATEPFQNDANTLLLLHMDGTDGSTVFIDDNGVN